MSEAKNLLYKKYYSVCVDVYRLIDEVADRRSKLLVRTGKYTNICNKLVEKNDALYMEGIAICPPPSTIDTITIIKLKKALEMLRKIKEKKDEIIAAEQRYYNAKNNKKTYILLALLEQEIFNNVEEAEKFKSYAKELERKEEEARKELFKLLDEVGCGIHVESDIDG